MAKKNKKKKSPVKKIIASVVIIAILIAVVILVLPSYQRSQAIQKDIDEYLQTLSLPTVIDKDVTVKQDGSDYFDVEIIEESDYLTYADSVIKVKRPTYFEGDIRTTITVKINVSSTNPIDKIIFNIFGLGKEQKIKVAITRLDAAPAEKVSYVKGSLFVPEYVNTNIGLITENSVFPDCTVTWQSSNTNIIADNGTVNQTGDAVLEATIECGGIEEKVDFSVTVGTELPAINEIELAFDDYEKSSKYQTITKNGVTMESVMIIETDVVDGEDGINDISQKFARFRIKPGSFPTIRIDNLISNIKSIDFDYWAEDQTSAFTKATNIALLSSVDNITWVEVKVTDNLTAGNYHFSYVETSTAAKYYKIELRTEYSEFKVEIDNLIVRRYIDNEDIQEALQQTINLNCQESVILPKTTKYGGVVNYQSSDEKLFTDLGAVTRQEKKAEVTLGVSVTGFNFTVNFVLPISISGYEEVTPVQIFFIDLGKYGANDCGEAIYIKVGNIEVLVDAGDHFESSQRAIKEVVDANSPDKVLEYVFATHPDADHIGGMPALFANYEIMNLIQFYGDHTTNIYRNYVAAYEAEGCDVCLVTDSYNNQNNCKRHIDLADQVFIEILDTKNYEGKETNTRSIVFILEAYGIRTLLTGDADNGSNKNLENDYKDSVGNIDILKAVHHGTREGTTTAFLQAVDPETVIITNGNYLGNKHGHPTPEAINRIYQYDASINVYATTGGDSEVCEVTSSGSYKCDVNDRFVDRNGTITITITDGDYTIASEYFAKPLELSSTTFWKENPLREYAHQ